MDNSPLTRQWLILRTLCSRTAGVTVRELAGEMEVSDKTIRRDLTTFQNAGIPIEESVGQNGTKYWKLDPSAARAEMGFTYDEAFALYLSRRYLAPLAGTQIWDAATTAFQKIRTMLGEAVVAYLNKTDDMFTDSTFGVVEYRSKAHVIDQLMIGIEDKKVVFLTYRSQRSTEPVTYDVHPYRFARHRNSLYLQGYKPDDESIRTWKVDRIEAASVDAMPFTAPESLDLDAELATGFGIFHSSGEPTRVVIRFSKQVTRFVQEAQWHPSQTNRLQPDGGLLVELEVAGLAELRAWVLSFGSQAEVVEPTSLRDQVTEEAQALLQLYTTTRAPHPK